MGGAPASNKLAIASTNFLHFLDTFSENKAIEFS